MKMTPEWDDIKVFLAVARLGTISKAGARLGIEHSTVSRRIDRLEKSVGSVLFDRMRSGYRLTETGQSLIPFAEKMEDALIEAEEGLEKTQHAEGAVRVGTPEAFGIYVMSPRLVDFHHRHPGIRIELMAQPQFPSLVTREVEILVTLERPKMGRYKVARLAKIDYYLYCSPEYKATHPPIDRLSDLERHSFVDYIHDGHMSEMYRVLEELVPSPKRCFSTTSVIAQRTAAASGLGLALLTPYVANQEKNLINAYPSKPLVTRNLWVAAPEDLLKIKRISMTWDFIRELIDDNPDYFHRFG